MAAPIVISILANASQANSTLNQTATTAQKIGAGFRKMAVPAAAGLAVLVAGSKRAIDSASDLQENVSKTGEVFGKQAPEIVKFAKTAEQSLGQSQTAALDAASTFGIIGEKAGLSGKDTAEFSKQFVTLASDMASFNNTSPEEAVTAIGAAMRGESEPIRKYGVLLDDATLRNRALKEGLIDNVKTALTPQQKALAASKEILAQTSKAQGDFARTSDGAANKSRILAAQQENLQAKIGKQLLPAYVRLQNLLSSALVFIERHQKAVGIAAAVAAGLAVAVLAVNAAMAVGSAAVAVYTGVTTAWSIAQRIATAASLGTRLGLAALTVQTIVTSAATKAAAAAQWLLNAAMTANPLALVVIALAALGAALVIAWQKSETFRAIVTGAWNRVKSAASSVGSFIASNWKRIGAVVLAAAGPIGWAALAIIKNWSRIKSSASSLLGAVRSAFNAVVSFVKGIPGKIKAAFSGAGSLLSSTGRQIIEGLIGGIKAMAGRAVDAAKGVVSGAVKGAKALLGIKSPSRVFRTIGEQTMDGLVIGLETKRRSVLKTVQNVAKDVSATPIVMGLTDAKGKVTIAGPNAYGRGPTNITVNVRLDSSMTEAEMGRAYKKAIKAAEALGVA